MIRLEYVNKSFGHRHVLRDVSLVVEKGEVLVRQFLQSILVRNAELGDETAS